MTAKRDYYKNYVNGKVRARKLIYFIILFIILCVVLYDSFLNNLPFHYILFIVAGRLLSLLLTKTQKVKLENEDGKLTIERNFSGLIIVLAVISVRILMVPQILSEFNVIFISDAIFLIVIGWFLGRINLLSSKIEESAFYTFDKCNGKNFHL